MHQPHSHGSTDQSHYKQLKSNFDNLMSSQAEIEQLRKKISGFAKSSKERIRKQHMAKAVNPFMKLDKKLGNLLTEKEDSGIA